jgi:hypothetical protein
MRLSPCWGCATARDASVRTVFAINRIRIIFQKHSEFTKLTLLLTILSMPTLSRIAILLSY